MNIVTKSDSWNNHEFIINEAKHKVTQFRPYFQKDNLENHPNEYTN